MHRPDAPVCTGFLFAAFVLAGAAHVLWLRSQLSAPFAVPLDGGKTFRDRRLFGANKTWRGFMVMVPAVGVAFVLLRGLLGWVDERLTDALWPLSSGQYFWLGCWVGLGFMAAELPNSFVKRQLDIPPGRLADHSIGRAVGFCIDRADSLLGGLLALSLVVLVPAGVWVYALVIGSAVHWGFSALLMFLGVKERAG